MQSEIAIKMDYIQDLFLHVQNYAEGESDLEVLFTYLDAESIEYRSIAYESASMALAYQDLSKDSALSKWKDFYVRSEKAHLSHIYIGLGWAYAKAEIIPPQEWTSSHPLMRWMVFDGMGYYLSLYRGRRTVKNQVVPEGIDAAHLESFDQGIGRRLWYIAKGNVEDLALRIDSFPISRHPNIWRGVGIACGYVGGCQQATFKLLSNASGQWKLQLGTGIALAALIRSDLDNINPNLELGCQLICKKSIKEIVQIKTKLNSTLDFSPSQHLKYWINQFEATLK